MLTSITRRHFPGAPAIYLIATFADRALAAFCLLFSLTVASSAGRAEVAPQLQLTVHDLTTGKAIVSGSVVPAGDQFHVTVTAVNYVDCAGQWSVTALGGSGAPPSVLVQVFDYIIGPASGGDSATGPTLSAGALSNGTNDWKISATCNGGVPGQLGSATFEFFVGDPNGTGGQPVLTLSVQDLTSGLPVGAGQVVSPDDEFQVTVTTNNVDCAGQWAVTALGGSGAPPSVLVQVDDYIIGPKSGGGSATGEPLSATSLSNGTNDWKISASCNGAGKKEFGSSTFEFFAGASIIGIQNVITRDTLTVTNSAPCPSGTSGDSCFSIQQNFFLTAPSSPPGWWTYWVQNALQARELSSGEWQVAHEYFVWSPSGLVASDGKPSWKSWPNTSSVTLESQLFGGTLNLEASIESAALQTFSYTPPTGSFIMTPLAETQNSSNPQLVMVGYGNGSTANFCSTGDCSTLGTLLTQVQLDQETWNGPGTQYVNAGCAGQTQEKSVNLQWYAPDGGSTATFKTTSEYITAEGIVFNPLPGATGLAGCQ